MAEVVRPRPLDVASMAGGLIVSRWHRSTGTLTAGMVQPAVGVPGQCTPLACLTSVYTSGMPDLGVHLGLTSVSHLGLTSVSYLGLTSVKPSRHSLSPK